MSDVSYPLIPDKMLLARYDYLLAGDYTKLWGHTVGVYHRYGVWQATIRLAPTRDITGEAVTAACYGAAIGADQAVWFLSAVDSDPDTPAYMADRYLVTLYADRWGGRLYRRRRVLIGDEGTVMGTGGWVDGPTGGQLLAVLGIPWGMDEPGDPAAIRRLLTVRGHSVDALDDH